jgi:hypothetical protein
MIVPSRRRLLLCEASTPDTAPRQSPAFPLPNRRRQWDPRAEELSAHPSNRGVDATAETWRCVMPRRRAALAALIIVAVLTVAGCAAGPNPIALTDQPDAAGFWLGLWQGLISPITFLISLFDNDVNIYEVNNNGNWYDFGFMLGVAMVFSGPAGSGHAARRRSRS